MGKTTNKFSPEVRERAVRLVLDNEGQHASRRQAVKTILAKIGCTPQTLNNWVKKAEVDSGRRAGIPTEMAAALEEPRCASGGARPARHPHGRLSGGTDRDPREGAGPACHPV